jgi:hypothetical protein
MSSLIDVSAEFLKQPDQLVIAGRRGLSSDSALISKSLTATCD